MMTTKVNIAARHRKQLKQMNFLFTSNFQVHSFIMKLPRDHEIRVNNMFSSTAIITKI
jgi:hypothetical protein